MSMVRQNGMRVFILFGAKFTKSVHYFGQKERRFVVALFQSWHIVQRMHGSDGNDHDEAD